MASPLQETPELKLTLKQRIFLKEYYKTGNGTYAARIAYDAKDDHIASTIASENIRKLGVSIKSYMESQGLSLGSLLPTIQEGLKAERIITSHTEPDYTVPDHLTRHVYLKTAAKWLGIEDKEGDTNVQVNILNSIKQEQDNFDV